MPAMDFPANPAVGDTHSVGTRTWRWDGVVWGTVTATPNFAPHRFVFSQPVAAATWSISHNLNGFPSVTVVDSAGTVVEGDVEYNSTGSITIRFGSSFSGTAYLN